ncbi:hypothetical protein QQP08_020738 [Theobroma cacao]|nr:hypothetical protein QQP08_020738 [Theobroma cacao]
MLTRPNLRCEKGRLVRKEDTANRESNQEKIRNMRERWESLQGMFEGTNVHGIGGGYGYQLKESMGNSKENREGRGDEGEKISSESEDDEKKNNELGRKLGEEWELNRMRRSKGVRLNSKNIPQNW